MGITYTESMHIFHLQSHGMSYAFQIVKAGYVAHLYWGKKVRTGDFSYLLRLQERAFAPNPDPADRDFSLDTLPQEYPGYGNTDFRSPAYQVRLENGATITDLRYQSHSIIRGKPKLEGLPATYAESEAEATTLNLLLWDGQSGLEVILSYTVFEEWDVITRSVRFANRGPQKLELLRALSMSFDFPHADYDLLHLPGSWARERYVERRPLLTGAQSVESRRGASSHQHNPFIALLDKGATEDFGAVYGLNLVYSGNFLAQAEVDQFQTLRVQMGINPFDFAWLLESGESFQTPEVVMVYSDQGLGGMSRTYHQLYRTRLCRGRQNKYNESLYEWPKVTNRPSTTFQSTSRKLEREAAQR